MHLSRFRPKFTLRWLMLAVAVVAIVLWNLKLSAEYSRRAKHFESKMNVAISYQSVMPEFWARQGHYAKMKQKYEHAACYPWLPVAPDPE